MSDENVGGLVELLPCPFCGGTDIGDEHVVTYSVDSSYDTFGCRTCGARFENGNASQWNARVSAHGQPEPNGKLVGWWNGVSRHDDRDGTGPSVRWGEGAENTYHDIPLYDGYNPIHYVTPPAHGQPVVDEAMVERAMDAFASVRVDPNSDTLDHDLMRAALTAALEGADHE